MTCHLSCFDTSLLLLWDILQLTATSARAPPFTSDCFRHVWLNQIISVVTGACSDLYLDFCCCCCCCCYSCFMHPASACRGHWRCALIGIRHFQDAYVKAGVCQTAAILQNVTGVYDLGTGTVGNVNCRNNWRCCFCFSQLVSKPVVTCTDDVVVVKHVLNWVLLCEALSFRPSIWRGKNIVWEVFLLIHLLHTASKQFQDDSHTITPTLKSNLYRQWIVNDFVLLIEKQFFRSPS